MKKRIASILLVLVMALSLIPTTVWAWTSTVSTFEALKSRISSRSNNNPIEIVVDGTIEISETLNIEPTQDGHGHMAWYEFWNQNIIISGADANSKLVRAEGFKGALFNLQGKQGYSGYQGSRLYLADPAEHHSGRRRRYRGGRICRHHRAGI